MHRKVGIKGLLELSQPSKLIYSTVVWRSATTGMQYPFNEEREKGFNIHFRMIFDRTIGHSSLVSTSYDIWTIVYRQSSVLQSAYALVYCFRVLEIPRDRHDKRSRQLFEGWNLATKPNPSKLLNTTYRFKTGLRSVCFTRKGEENEHILEASTSTFCKCTVKNKKRWGCGDRGER